ncbi:MAG: UvrD-helicase domain-containing protein [Propionibacteriaceae bacterium]|nr:UvrD-helicase domain-containing protein [Propionibacteriaceae bacterium]
MHIDRILDQLDEDQRRVVCELGRPVSVIAGAGTGKTATLTHRLAYAATTGQLDPAATLALTFTTAAAQELVTRLASMGVPSVQSRTFHSACLRQAQYFWPQAYNCSLPPVQADRTGLIAQACSTLGLTATTPIVRQIDQEISWTKQTNVLAEQYVDLARAEQRTVAHVAYEQVAEAIVAYEQAKQTACVIDLDDLLLCVVALLTTCPEVARQVRARYRHFVFDEFQDVSPVQSRLVDLWVGDREDVCVVGDPAQTIHSFAGSRSVYLERFGVRHARTSELTLTRNYRSTPQILHVANAVTSSVQLTATLPPGAPVTFAASPSRLDEAEAIVAWVKQVHHDGVDWSDIALLWRTHGQAASIRQILTENHVPFVCNVNEVGSPRDGIHLGTLHASKGQQWLVVGLCGLSDSSLPHPLATSPAQLAEEKRLLYVGVTRARSLLRLSWPTQVDGRITAVSRFVAPLWQAGGRL